MRKKVLHVKRLIDMFVFGSQYYRPPNPPVEEFEDDFKRMVDLNFNTARIWLVWRWMERRKGEYRFDEADRLFDLGERYGLRILANIIIPLPPQFVIREYPDCVVVRLDRSLEHPGAAGESFAYQIGGYRPCFDHPGLRRSAEDFMDKVVKRYKERSMLLAWHVWNEHRVPVCACKHTVNKYRNWLKQRFGTVEELNDAWGLSYGYWEDVDAPYRRPVFSRAGYEDTAEPWFEVFTELLLFGEFTCENQGEQIGWISDYVRKLDTSHPTMTHHGSNVMASPLSATGHDARLVAQQVDIYGSTVHPVLYQGYTVSFDPMLFCKYPWALDYARSAKREFWVTELSANIDPKWMGIGEVPPGDTTLRLWTAVAHGALGIIYWQFKPERYGQPESPGWGLVEYDGSSTIRSDESKVFGETIKQYGAKIVGSEPYPAQVGLYYDRRINIMSDLIREDWYAATQGTYYALWTQSIHTKTVTPEDDWTDLKMVYLPYPILVDQGAASKIGEYVEGGGTVVSEAFLGKYRGNSFHSTRVPGSGLHKIFGIEEKQSGHAENVELTSTTDTVPGFRRDSRAHGSGGVAKLRSSDAQVLARLSTGEPTLTLSNHGKGKAFYIATFPSFHIARTRDEDTVRMIGGLAELAGVRAPATARTPNGLSLCRVLEDGSDKMLFVFNHGQAEADMVVETAWTVHSVERVYGEAPVLTGKSTLQAKAPARSVVVCILHTV